MNPKEYKWVNELDISATDATSKHPKSYIAFDLWNGKEPSGTCYLMATDLAKKFGKALIRWANKVDFWNYINKLRK